MIYIHFPYCLSKCHYCDFNSYAHDGSTIPFERYQKSLLHELAFKFDHYQQTGTGFFASATPVDSIFFGGGTPSLMVPAHIQEILECLSRYVKFAPDIEITLESNPGTLTLSKIKAFKQAGINRLSIGVQSLWDKNLGAFGRIHTADEALQTIDRTLQSNFDEVSCDLIFGFPGQTVAEWHSDLAKILTFGLNHISCYSLMCEEKTLYSHAVKNGKITEIPDDILKEMLSLTYDCMAVAGLNAYEISNFAKPGHECRHNLGYWNYEQYLGLGAGAVGQYFDMQTGSVIRETNKALPDIYMEGVGRGDFNTTETVDKATAMSEFVMMGLRLKDGIRFERFLNRFGVEFLSVYERAVDEGVKLGLLERSESGVLPTRQGFLYNNRLVGLFF